MSILGSVADMSTWEDRMAARAAERAAGRSAAEAAEREGRRASGEPGNVGVPGHKDHHWHVKSNYTICSCGELIGGAFTVALDQRWWSDDPAERAAVEREEADFQAWITCRYCGQVGVIADDDFGVWPPRTLNSAQERGR
jgi:hypothetical protein